MQDIGQVIHIVVEGLNPIPVVYASTAMGGAMGGGGTSSTTQSASTPSTASTTNGGFLDFIIAIICLICMLMTHKFIRHFLDMLIPAGGRGGMFGSALMEGMGLAVGSKIAKGGITAVKTAGGLLGAAGIAGAAAALKKPVDMGALMKSVRPPGVGAAGGVKSGATSLYPGGIGTSPDPLGLGNGAMKYGDGFTMQDSDMGDSFAESMEANSSTGSSSSSSGFATAFSGGSMFTGASANTATSKLGSVFDKGSKTNGAFTKLSPGAGGALDRFMGAAGNRLKSDVAHKLHNGDGRFRGNYAGGADNLLGVAMQEFKGVKEDNAEETVGRDMMLPSKEIKDAHTNGDPFAAMQMQSIGRYQDDMLQGYEWMEQGQELMDTTEPQLEDVGAELDALDFDFDRGGSMITAMEMAGLSESMAYQEAQQNQAAIETQRQAVKHRFESLQAQMDSGQRMYQRGEKRVINAQNNIGRINYSFYDDKKRNSKYMIDAAARAAGRKSLSDL